MTPAYESPAELQTYLQFHYGAVPERFPAEFGLRPFEEFPARVVQRLVVPGEGSGRALDLGCGVGRSTFELSRTFAEVIGVDLSGSFIAAAERLRQGGRHPVRVPVTGHEYREAEARVPEGTHPERVRFLTGDAGALPELGGAFDCVIALNLLCRVPAPRVVLRSFRELVRPGGQLVLATPWSWLEAYTPPDAWLAGEPVAALAAELTPDFRLETVEELPFLIRETERKYQWGISQGSAWRRAG